MLIDSHHHLWRYSPDEYGWIDERMSVLRQDFLAQELRQIASDNHVDGFVTVQARQTIQESRDLLAISESEPLIRGVVGWAPLASPEIGGVLDEFCESPSLKGIRHVVQDEPDDEFLLGKAFNTGVAMLKDRWLVYDILIYARQLSVAHQFVQLHPDQSFVLDHIAKPTVRSSGRDQQWAKEIRQLAEVETVTCKFSGVVTEVRDESWSIETVRPYWDLALEAFTPKRLMFGSDWPVCLMKTEYKRWLDVVRQLTGELSDDEQADIFAGTASRIYDL